MPRRRKAIAPQTEIGVLVERMVRLEQQVRRLSQAGPNAVQPDDHQLNLAPFPWESLMHHPGGHRDAWPTDNLVYYHPGKVDQDTGEYVTAGYKAVSGPVCKPFKLFADNVVTLAGLLKFGFMIPEDLHRTRLLRPAAFVTTPGSSTTTIQVRKIYPVVRTMLLTPITIGSGQYTSYQGTPPVVNDTPKTDDPYNKVYTGDLLSIDVSTAGVGSKGLGVYLYFQ